MAGAFETALTASSEPAAVPRLRSWQRPVPAAMGLLAAMAISALVVWSLTRPGPASQPQVTHFAVPVEGGHEMFFDECPRLALSPDGRVLAYVASGQLRLRRLDSLDAATMAGTAGAESLFFSPDGRSLGFAQGGMLKSLSLADGLITEVTRVGSSNYDCVGASWGPDGTIVYRPAGARVLFSVPAVGGTPAPLTTIRDPAVETFHHWPQVIDGGQRLLFTIIGPGAGWEDAKIVVEDLDTHVRTTVVEQGTYGRYVPTGHIVYATAPGTLFAVPYDPARGAPAGDRFPVMPDVRVAGWGGAASFAMSDAGTAAFVHGSNQTRQLLWWVDREGRRVRQVGSALSSWVLRLSPDGRRVAVEVHQPVNGDVVLVDTATGQPERLTFGAGFDQAPVWSPDGRRVAYATYGTEGNSAPRIDVQDVDAGGQAITVYTEEAATDVWLSSWSLDGWLAFFEAEAGNNDVYAVHVEDPEQKIGVAVSAANEGDAYFSPNGRWLAYGSDETGRQEIYVVSFPEIGRPTQVSADGGFNPRWSAAGDELFFWKDTTLMRSAVSTGETFSSGVPQPLFEAPDITEDFAYDVAPDGDLFLLALRNPDAPAKEIHVVQHFDQELLERAPAP